MSRSYRHSLYGPIAGCSAGSMRWYRRYWNSKERRRWKDAIIHGEFEQAEYSIPWDEWDSPRDGVVYYGPSWYNSKKRLSR